MCTYFNPKNYSKKKMHMSHKSANWQVRGCRSMSMRESTVVEETVLTPTFPIFVSIKKFIYVCIYLFINQRPTQGHQLHIPGFGRMTL